MNINCIRANITKSNETDAARAASSDRARAEVTGEVVQVSNEVVGAAPTGDAVAQLVAGVKGIYVDALVDAREAAGATISNMKGEEVVGTKGGCSGGGDRERKSGEGEKESASVLAVLMSQPLPDIPRRVVTTVVPLAPPSGPVRTALLRQEHTANRAQTAAWYESVIETFPGQSQLHDFGRDKSVARSRPSPPLTLAEYAAM